MEGRAEAAEADQSQISKKSPLQLEHHHTQRQAPADEGARRLHSQERLPEYWMLNIGSDGDMLSTKKTNTTSAISFSGATLSAALNPSSQPNAPIREARQSNGTSGCCCSPPSPGGSDHPAAATAADSADSADSGTTVVLGQHPQGPTAEGPSPAAGDEPRHPGTKRPPGSPDLPLPCRSGYQGRGPSRGGWDERRGGASSGLAGSSQEAPVPGTSRWRQERRLSELAGLESISVAATNAGGGWGRVSGGSPAGVAEEAAAGAVASPSGHQPQPRDASLLPPGGLAKAVTATTPLLQGSSHCMRARGPEERRPCVAQHAHQSERWRQQQPSAGRQEGPAFLAADAAGLTPHLHSHHTGRGARMSSGPPGSEALTAPGACVRAMALAELLEGPQLGGIPRLSEEDAGAAVTLLFMKSAGRRLGLQSPQQQQQWRQAAATFTRPQYSGQQVPGTAAQPRLPLPQDPRPQPPRPMHPLPPPPQALHSPPLMAPQSPEAVQQLLAHHQRLVQLRATIIADLQWLMQMRALRLQHRQQRNRQQGQQHCASQPVTDASALAAAPAAAVAAAVVAASAPAVQQRIPERQQQPGCARSSAARGKRPRPGACNSPPNGCRHIGAQPQQQGPCPSVPTQQQQAAAELLLPASRKQRLAVQQQSALCAGRHLPQGQEHEQEEQVEQGGGPLSQQQQGVHGVQLDLRDYPLQCPSHGARGGSRQDPQRQPEHAHWLAPLQLGRRQQQQQPGPRVPVAAVGVLEATEQQRWRDLFTLLLPPAVL